MIHFKQPLVPWGREESDTTERLHFHFSLSCTAEGNRNPLQCSCLENPRGSPVGCHLRGHRVEHSWRNLASAAAHPHMTTGKTTALTRLIFAGKVMSLLLNMLSRLVITFLPRSKCLIILWVQSPSAVILGPPKKCLSLFPLFPHLFPMKWLDWMPWC